MKDFLRSETIPFGTWVEQFVMWLVANIQPALDAIKPPINAVLSNLEGGLVAIPPVLFVLAVAIAVRLMSNWSLTFVATGCGLLLALFGIWNQSMITLSVALTGVLFCIVIGFPLGVLAARIDKFGVALRPVLDIMQTTPSFVYLVPIVMLFGIGKVPGVLVTAIYGMPPLIRLTRLGIQQVDREVIEAGLAFGATPTQLLFKIQIPLALPTIMAGVNQTIMLSLAMTVISSMIGVNGLGQMVLQGIGRLDIALAATGGAGVVLLAIMLDRFSQAIGVALDRRTKHASRVRPAPTP